MSGATLKLVVAVGVLVVGIVVLVRAYTTNVAAPPSAPEAPVSAAPDYEERVPGYISAANMTFNEHPTPASVPRVAKDAAETLLAGAPEQLASNAALPEPLLRDLAHTFERHLAVILAADYDEWLSFAESVGLTFSAPAGEQGGPPTRESFNTGARYYKLAPINTRGVFVRPSRIDGEEIEHDTIGITVYGTPFAPYPVPDDPRADVYEVVAPMQLARISESSPDMNMNVAFGYVWSHARQRWIPYSLVASSDRGGNAGMTRY